MRHTSYERAFVRSLEMEESDHILWVIKREVFKRWNISDSLKRRLKALLPGLEANKVDAWKALYDVFNNVLEGGMSWTKEQ